MSSRVAMSGKAHRLLWPFCGTRTNHYCERPYKAANAIHFCNLWCEIARAIPPPAVLQLFREKLVGFFNRSLHRPVNSRQGIGRKRACEVHLADGLNLLEHTFDFKLRKPLAAEVVSL